MDARLHIHHSNLTIRRCKVGLPVASILFDFCATKALISEHRLVENEQVSVNTIVDLQISHSLDANVVKEFVIESTDWETLFK